MARHWMLKVGDSRTQWIWWGWLHWSFGVGTWQPHAMIFQWVRIGPLEMRRFLCSAATTWSVAKDAQRERDAAEQRERELERQLESGP